MRYVARGTSSSLSQGGGRVASSRRGRGRKTSEVDDDGLPYVCTYVCVDVNIYVPTLTSPLHERLTIESVRCVAAAREYCSPRRRWRRPYALRYWSTWTTLRLVRSISPAVSSRPSAGTDDQRPIVSEVPPISYGRLPLASIGISSARLEIVTDMGELGGWRVND